jgi:hypothetical protein
MIAPVGAFVKFAKVLLNPFAPSTDKDILQKVAVDPATAVEVPITWE